MADQYQSKEQYSTPANPPPSTQSNSDSFKITGVTDRPTGDISQTPWGKGTPQYGTPSGGGGGGGGGRSGTGSYRLPGVTEPTQQAVQQVSRSAYGVQGGYQGDVRIMGGQQIRVTSAARAGPESNAAYNAAYATAGEINRKLGGQEYVRVTRQDGEFIVEQNPGITAQPGIAQQIRDFLGGAKGVTVTEEGGRFRVAEKSSVSATAPPLTGSTAPATGKRPSLSLGFADVQPKGTPQMGSPTDNIIGGRSQYPVSPQYATPAYGQEVTISREPARVNVLTPEQILKPESTSRPRTISQAVQEASTASKQASSSPAGKVTSITTPVTPPSFEQTPVQQVYQMKLGESLRGSAMDALANTFGPGARELDKPVAFGISPADVAFGAPAYAADIGFETAKTAFVPSLYGNAASQAASFQVREAVGIQVSQQERNAAISDFATGVQYSPNVPVFVALIAASAAKPQTDNMLVGQQKTIGAIRVRAGDAEFKSALGAPTAYDVGELKAGRASDIFIGKFTVGEQPARGIVPVDALGNVGAGISRPSAPFSIELVKGTVRGTIDPYRLSVSEAIKTGAIFAGYEAGAEIISGQPVNPTRVAQAGIAGGALIYPVTKAVPLAQTQRVQIAQPTPPSVIEGKFEATGTEIIPYRGPPGPTGKPPLDVRGLTPIVPSEQKPYYTPGPYTPPANKVTVQPGDFVVVGPSKPGPVGARQRQIMRYQPRKEIIEVTQETQLQPTGELGRVVVETETPFSVRKPTGPGEIGPVVSQRRNIRLGFESPIDTTAIKPQFQFQYQYQPQQAPARLQPPRITPIQPDIVTGITTQPIVPSTGQTETQVPFTPSTPTPEPQQTVIIEPPKQPDITTNISVTAKPPGGILGFGLPFLPQPGTLGGGTTTGRRTRTPGEARSLLETALEGTETGRGLKVKPPKAGPKGGLRTPLG